VDYLEVMQSKLLDGVSKTELPTGLLPTLGELAGVSKVSSGSREVPTSVALKAMLSLVLPSCNWVQIITTHTPSRATHHKATTKKKMAEGSAVGLGLGITGMIMAVIIMMSSLVVIALYAYDTDGAETDCQVYRTIFQDQYLEISDRTAGVGLSCACLSFIVALLAIPLWLAGGFVESKAVHMICRLLLVFLSLLLAAYFVPAWALLSKDIEDIDSNCDTPESWGAALAMALYTDIFWFWHTVFSLIVLFVEGCSKGGFFLPE
jgi:hypothetical protein